VIPILGTFLGDVAFDLEPIVVPRIGSTVDGKKRKT